MPLILSKHIRFLQGIPGNILSITLVACRKLQRPHNYFVQATEALKPVLGDYYLYDGRNVHKAMWDDWRITHYVAPDRKDDGTLWFRK